MSAEKKVRDYILQNFLFSDDTSALNNDDPLVGRGIIDSTGALELINFLEEEFGVKVADEEMVPQNLDSVNKILAYLKNKQEQVTA